MPSDPSDPPGPGTPERAGGIGTASASPDSPPPLVLASASPRRAALLEMLGLSFESVPARIPEDPRPGEGSRELALRLARAKALAVAADRPGALVLGGDTVVVLDDRLLAKPADEKDAVRMLLELSGRTHEVLTALALALPGGEVLAGVSPARVTFRSFGRATAEAYAATGEPLDKAGGYGIQARGAALVGHIRGDYYSVVGLPVALFLELLEEAGWLYRFGSLERPVSRGGSR